MPPKDPKAAGKGNKDEKVKKPKQSQIVLNKAIETADKLFKMHERERVKMETADRFALQKSSLDEATEKERLRQDQEIYTEFLDELEERKVLAYKEYEKHRLWNLIPEASRLPPIRSQSAINTFLSAWRDREKVNTLYFPSVEVHIKRDSSGNFPRVQRFHKGELGISQAACRRMLTEELNQCVTAYELVEKIRLEADRSLTFGQTADLDFFNENIGNVCEQVMDSFDFVTSHALLNYDIALDGPESEFLTVAIPPTDPVTKFGLWVKVKETTRSFASLVFPTVSVRLDPKSTALPKLPKALGLSKENVAVRVVQVRFDPYGHYGCTGKEYYALPCVIRVDLLNFTERPKQSGDWLFRSETEEAHKLDIVPYPPPVLEGTEESPVLRVSFEVPSTIAMRQPTLLIGKWVEKSKEWEPCSHTTAASELSMPERMCSFAVGEFGTFTILQGKGFDVPYEYWRLQPVSCDEVIMVLEGRHRGEASDREFRILIHDAKCKLIYPNDPELTLLREQWMEPATLVRLLSQAGFNFLLHDDDAVYLEGIVPKSSALENKVYADIAQFCLFYVIAGSRHNKCGEDPNLALFRMSTRTHLDADDAPDLLRESTDGWHSVRYQTHCCAFAAFDEVSDVPDLRILEGHETHLNLYTLLLKEKGEEVRLLSLHRTNFLLRRCVYQLLSLVRPLTWG
uniref:Uncharacterized protein TCIL3000_4_280 n=1 Tax=Trypanosoma congolense (strain IL3000) TaxID=1068625 RepID=G0UKP1_TRYCI|nr:unnamed protein product [Trypanosoma congolense IL3000]